MREILFRGKRIDNGEWVEGIPWIFSPPVDKAIIIYAMGEVGEDDGVSRYCESCEVYPESISQFTGCYDKNGKKIFEGDIVFLHDYIIGEIVFECGTFGIGACKPFDYDHLESEIALITGCHNSPDFCYNDNFISLWELYWNYNQDNNILEVVEVIGNVYDNPELLEVME